jgi:hypothetical protein
MFNIIFIILCFNILIKEIISEKIQNCELNSNCQNCDLNNNCEIYKCSNYGNCNFRLVNNKQEIYCQCNKGYSSYNRGKNDVFCCYKKKSLLISFLLELFIGFGSGHIYLGNTVYATIKLCLELFFCVGMICVTYYACIREHPFQTNTVDVNNNENIGKNNINENKNKENEINEENEEKANENIIDNKNNESKDESFELEENKENERMFQNFISCPKSKIFIYFSIIFYFLFNFIDAVLIAFGKIRDGEGEELFLGY